MTPVPPRVFVRPHGWVGADARGEARRLIAWVRHAEALGFDGVFLGDRMLASATGTRGPVYGASMLEVTTMLAALAAATERILLGSLVYVIPYRHPVQVAKVTATLDVIADGRLILGVGTGWNEREFEVLGIDTAGRGDRFEEALALVRQLWSGDPVTASGRWWPVEDVHVTPRPVRPGGPPVWIASFSPDSALDWQGEVPGAAARVLDRVGRMADGWVPLIYSASSKRRLDADVLGAAWEHVLAAAYACGRRREDIDFVYSDWCYVLGPGGGSRAHCEAALGRFFAGDWEAARRTYTIGTADEILERIRTHTSGVDRVDAYVFTPLDDGPAQLEALAEQLLPALRDGSTITTEDGY